MVISSSITNSTDTFYGILCSGLTDKTRFSFTSSNSSFTECTRKHNSFKHFSNNISCNSNPYSDCTEMLQVSISGSEHASYSFTNCKFSQMNTNYQGAAICSVSASTKVTLNSCILKDCTSDKNGGAIYLNGSNSLTVMDTLFLNCVTNSDETDPGGGGMYINSSVSSHFVYRSTFIKCFANVFPRGGGGFIASNVKVSHTFSSVFVSCFSNSTGGAVFFYQNVNAFSISDTVFIGNQGTTGGGAIRELYNAIQSTPHLKFSFFTGNTAPADNGNDFCVSPEIQESPFLYSFSTTDSNRIAYSHGNDAHEYDGN